MTHRLNQRGVTVQVLARTFKLLEILANAGGPKSLKDLSFEADLNPSTACRLLKDLQVAGYVAQEGTKYQVGLAAQKLAQSQSRNVPHGWKMSRDGHYAINVDHPAAGPGPVQVRTPPNSKTESLLFSLCDDILGDREHLP